MSGPRILLSAYQCGPGMGSVSQIGWEWYSRLSAQAILTLVTHSRNRKALESAGAPIANSEIIYVDTEWFAGPLYRFACRLFPRSQHAVFLISSLDFFVYDAAALKKLRTRRRDWNVVHAVTPVSPVATTRLHRLGLPLIVGPWNGGLRSPQAFSRIMQEDSGWIYQIRGLRRLLDWLTGCTRHASLVLSATHSTDMSVPKHANLRRMIENGVDLQLFSPAPEKPAPSASEPLRVLFVGRLLPFKGLSLLFEAISRVRSEFPIQLKVVGEGPLRSDLEQECASRDLTKIVRFEGSKSLREVAKYMAEAHVFCLPSIRESGGAVLLEAMASELPILAVNYGGPAEIVDEKVGQLLSAQGPTELVGDMATAFRNVVARYTGWRQKGTNGRTKAEQLYGWDARIDQAKEIYEWAMNSKKITQRLSEIPSHGTLP